MGDDPNPDIRQSQQLLESAQGGNPGAAEKLCRAYLPQLRQWAHGRLPRGARTLVDTEDLVQDVFRNTLINLPRFEYRRVGSFQSYLRESVRNRVKQEIRSVARGRLAKTWKERAAATASPLEELLGKERLERFESAFDRLSASDQEAITARVEMGMTYREVAQALGKPSEDAARMAVGRALGRLLQEMSR